MKTTLKQLVSKVWCLNWKGAKQRWEETLRACQEHGLPVERWPGPDKNLLPDLPHLSAGGLATTLGHLAMMEALLESKDEAWLLFEDDVKFCAKFGAHFREVELDVPTNWQVLFLGVSYREGGKLINEQIFKLEKAYALHAYVINRSGAKAVLGAWAAAPRRMGDHYTHDLMKDGKLAGYCVQPYWAIQHDGLSDGDGRVRLESDEGRFGGYFEADQKQLTITKR